MGLALRIGNSYAITPTSNQGFGQIGVRLTHVNLVNHLKPTIGYGANLDLGKADGHFGFSLGVMRWSYIDDEDYYTITYSDWAFKLNERYLVPFKGVTPYLGAGIDLHFLACDWKIKATDWYPAYSHWEYKTRFGFHFLAGVEVPVYKKIATMIETEYDFVEDEDQFIFGGGITYRFWK
jgi:opacity protein-like surface antigen